MTSATNRLEDAAVTRAALATTFDADRPLAVRGRLWRAAVAIGDLFAGLGVVLLVPLMVLAIGIPIALCVRGLLWIGGLL